MAGLAVKFLPFLCNNASKKSLPSCCVCGVLMMLPVLPLSYLSLTDFSLLFLSLCLSKIRAKGVEHLVHYFRDTAWYSTACLFYKTSSQPLLLCLHGLVFCTVRTAHLHYIVHSVFMKPTFFKPLFVFHSLLSSPLCLSFSLICLTNPYNFVKSKFTSVASRVGDMSSTRLLSLVSLFIHGYYVTFTIQKQFLYVLIDTKTYSELTVSKN